MWQNKLNLNRNIYVYATSYFHWNSHFTLVRLKGCSAITRPSTRDFPIVEVAEILQSDTSTCRQLQKNCLVLPHRAATMVLIVVWTMWQKQPSKNVVKVSTDIHQCQM